MTNSQLTNSTRLLADSDWTIKNICLWLEKREAKEAQELLQQPRNPSRPQDSDASQALLHQMPGPVLAWEDLPLCVCVLSYWIMEDAG